MTLIDEYRRQLAIYLNPADVDRILPLVTKAPSELSQTERATLADAAQVIRYAKSN